MKRFKKCFKINPPIGTARHSVSYNDGVKAHEDGSPFFDIKIFRTKIEKARFVRELTNQGYTEIEG